MPPRIRLSKIRLQPDFSINSRSCSKTEVLEQPQSTEITLENPAENKNAPNRNQQFNFMETFKDLGRFLDKTVRRIVLHAHPKHSDIERRILEENTPVYSIRESATRIRARPGDTQTRPPGAKKR
jgi:hypothetical protein